MLFRSLVHRLAYEALSGQFFELIRAEKRSIPSEFHYGYVCNKDEAEDAREAELGAIRFVSALSRVDGAIQCVGGLVVNAFGVEIIVKDDPKSLQLSTAASAGHKGLKPASIEGFGTRHRSMMRYCSKYPGSIGFVISQDGDVRVITRVGHQTVIWDNIRLDQVQERSLT